jgi:predicted RecB family nuclease
MPKNPRRRKGEDRSYNELVKAHAGQIRIAATDLSNHLACTHVTVSDLAVAHGLRSAPDWKSPDAWVLQQRGFEHERAYIEYLAAEGFRVADLSAVESDAATAAAMRDGADVIVQATMTNGRWYGRADVLRKVARASLLGEWSYEVYDCKLARETKAATILQLSLYSELLSAIQGVMPEFMYVVPPAASFQAEAYRVPEFGAYYRYVKVRLERMLERGADGPQGYPEPNAHCSVCRWWAECDSQWRRDDHLSLVAGISKLQRKQLEVWQVATMEQLAALPLPVAARPEYGSRDSYARVREQARMQVEGRRQGRPVHELLPVTPGCGFSRLPEPSAGDIFFDLEGDPFVGSAGREYLFGFAVDEGAGAQYQFRWALTPAEEKAAFEWFVDYAMARWAAYPAMHIYHYADYEPSALKRLMGRYATRENEIDRMLRAGLLVDLRKVVKQALRASVEEYSLKALEAFHGFLRTVPLERARTALRQMEHALELGRPADPEGRVANTVAGYNADDCLSTQSLRDWLERERTAVVATGIPVPRPEGSDGVAGEKVSERQQRVAALIGELTCDIPADERERTPDQAGRWLLANLLDWHRREVKSEWWEYYDLKDSSDEDLLDKQAGVAGLTPVGRIGWHRKLPIYRYGFEKQETCVRAGDTVCSGDLTIGEVVEVDLANRTLDIRKSVKAAEVHPTAVFVNSLGPNTDAMADSLFRLGAWVRDNGLDADGPYGAARDLLMRRPPRLRDGLPLPGSVLPVQGPPGAGKTYMGARMICALLREGKRVGVVATSHKVIRLLLSEVVKAAAECGLQGLEIVEKVKENDEDGPVGIRLVLKNEDAFASLESGVPVVVGGTSWMWSREEFRDTVDVLFVDEAGQMSVANALAVAQAAKSLVLLGDPQQLEQPLKGSHPEGAEVSALEHLLDGAKTMPAGRGLFLEKTWRLHPRVCEFTSEVFYEGRLEAQAGMERQRIEGHAWLGNAGLWFVPVEHTGNRNSSPEEVERIAALVAELLRPGVEWIDAKGARRPLTLSDVLMIAPYNVQVSDLAARIPGGRVGTVDKFQGQEAPVVIYSLTTSSPEEAPRGMEFLYSLNRLNVATSRGRAVVIVVGSPRLLEPECRNVRQMLLASGLCRFAEMAGAGDIGVRLASI